MDEPRNRMLIVEDHEPTRRILASLLARQGWDVHCAATIAEGLDQLEEEPDCVLLDLMLPDGRGEAILERAGRDHPRTRVIVTSATGDEDRLSALAPLHPAALMRKPIEISALLRTCGKSGASLPPH